MSSPYLQYKHLTCECSGIIGMYDRKHFTCEKCKKDKNITGESYHFEINPNTGWVFPMIQRKDE